MRKGGVKNAGVLRADFSVFSSVRVYEVPTKESISNYRGQLPDRSGDAWTDVNWVTDHLHGNFENSGPVWRQCVD